jgi:GDP-L-fucose synthase
MHEAKINDLRSVEIWGSGKPLREFLHVDDLANACLHLMLHYNEELFVNIGSGEDLSIAELAQIVKEIVGFEGELKFNRDKPDGTPRKLMDINKINSLGWANKISLKDGLKITINEFILSHSCKKNLKEMVK